MKLDKVMKRLTKNLQVRARWEWERAGQGVEGLRGCAGGLEEASHRTATYEMRRATPVRAAFLGQVDLELYRFSGRGRRESIDGENAACVEELSELIGEAERAAVDAGTVAGAREALAQLEQAAESRAAIS